MRLDIQHRPGPPDQVVQVGIPGPVGLRARDPPAALEPEAEDDVPLRDALDDGAVGQPDQGVVAGFKDQLPRVGGAPREDARGQKFSGGFIEHGGNLTE